MKLYRVDYTVRYVDGSQRGFRYPRHCYAMHIERARLFMARGRCEDGMGRYVMESAAVVQVDVPDLRTVRDMVPA